jgi:hypothetical protein
VFDEWVRHEIRIMPAGISNSRLVPAG